jgi:acetyl esterase/lipase
MLSLLQLSFAIILFLVAQLTWARAFTHILWELSIGILEGGYFAVLPCLMLAWWSFKTRPFGHASAVLYLLTALLFALPLFQAVQTASRLERSFERGFGKTVPAETFHRTQPLIWKDLWVGIHFPKVEPLQKVYAVYTEETGDSSKELSLDFYPAASQNTESTNASVHSEKAPCVIVIHGGGWNSDDRKELAPLNGYLSSLGYAVASIDYRLSPRYTYPAPVMDVQNALRFLRKHAEEWNLDTTRFILLGRSAGGQIALQAAYTLKDPGIKGVIAFYAPADMVFGYSLPGNPLLLDSRKLMEDYLRGSYSQNPAAYHNSSPVESVDSSSPPTLLLQGHRDVLVSFQHTVHLEKKLSALGVDHFTVDLPWATHGYDFVFSGPGSQISLYFMERFLAKVAQ